MHLFTKSIPLFSLLLSILLSSSSINGQVPNTTFMAWSAYTDSSCSSIPTYDFMTPVNECLNSSSVSFNPFNFTSQFMKIVQKETQLIGFGCTDAACGKCGETETINMQLCSSNSWVGNTTAYFSYSVVEGLIPKSKAGGLVYTYFNSNDTTCSNGLVGANIQENSVCTNVGGGFYFSYSCNVTSTIIIECVDALCTQNCTTSAYPFEANCQNGSSGNAVTHCYQTNLSDIKILFPILLIERKM